MADNLDSNDELAALGPKAVAAALSERRGTLPPIPPYDGEGEPEIGELPGVINPADWCSARVPARRFILQGWIVRGACGLLSGQEGVGKSLLAQQMATCAAAGRPFLGLDIASVPSIYVTCEDPADELWRRQADINAALGITMGSLEDRLRLVSLKGVIGNELGTFTTEGRLQISQRYRQLEKLCTDFGAGLVYLDNAAHFFAGNENARHDVAAFLGLLEQLSETIDGAVVLLAHPNKQHAQGNTAGNEYSGSTGWSAHVRNRLFLDWSNRDEDGHDNGGDGRVLRKSKANYSRQGEEIICRWHDWAFVRDEDLPVDTRLELDTVIRANAENAAFLRCLAVATEAKRAVSHNPGINYFGAIFPAMPESRGYRQVHFKAAFERLLHLGEIELDRQLWRGDNRHWKYGIRAAPTCANPPAKMAENLALTPAPTSCADPRQAAPETAENLAPTCVDPCANPSPSTTYIQGGPFVGPPPCDDSRESTGRDRGEVLS